MLKKIFGNKKKPNNLPLNPFQTRGSGKSVDPVKKGSKAVKIMHPGGHAEYHYMAIPASKIIEKYPSFVLTRPEFFRRPWDTIIRPDETLVPGQKYYVVPRQTVRKLRRRIKRTTSVSGLIKPGLSVEPNSFESLSISTSKSGILVKPGPKRRTRNLHVRFFGVDTHTTNKKSDPGLVSSVPNCDDKKKAETGLKNGHMERRIRNENGWEPSLDAINEAS